MVGSGYMYNGQRGGWIKETAAGPMSNPLTREGLNMEVYHLCRVGGAAHVLLAKHMMGKEYTFPVLSGIHKPLYLGGGGCTVLTYSDKLIYQIH